MADEVELPVACSEELPGAKDGEASDARVSQCTPMLHRVLNAATIYKIAQGQGEAGNEKDYSNGEVFNGVLRADSSDGSRDVGKRPPAQA